MILVQNSIHIFQMVLGVLRVTKGRCCHAMQHEGCVFKIIWQDLSISSCRPWSFLESRCSQWHHRCISKVSSEIRDFIHLFEFVFLQHFGSRSWHEWRPQTPSCPALVWKTISASFEGIQRSLWRWWNDIQHFNARRVQRWRGHLDLRTHPFSVVVAL